MRRMVLMKYCGVEWVEDRLEVTAVVHITHNGRDLDLCEEHADKISIKLLEAAVQKYGTPSSASAPVRSKKSAAKAAKANDSLECSVCDYVAKTRAGRGTHEYAKHGIQGSSKEAYRRRAAIEA